ncbi:tetratricopeptide repeat protein [Oricola cellulosilytica]|uniref:Tetratricopeptide repeat protein n=1 Tax=Oricola cellulosilytica TaxID=1429082 RepID=A0A4R0PAT9_9HYPH|nr:tetratricopeptide repeat protein [Oricola cellulosilytica]TCD13415.1 tetratricopeptide repeat protein [Oricola cellulosilytica]
MSDDSFIREVEEELRSDRLQSIWKRYGPFVIGAAVAIVLATAGYRAWEYYTDSRASASGDRFLAALNDAGEGNTEAALAELRSLEQDGYGAYPVLARMRAATLLQQQGDAAGAVAAFDEVAADGSAPDAIRDIARIRAAYILVDSGSASDVAERAEPLASDSHPMRHAAREALGLAAWKEERLADAKALFQQILDDPAAPRNTMQRASLMLDLITATGKVAEG